ncbi:MAG: 4'-phosphopantetheinyl transferase superfamily protein, partial [Firmicutes bacterium]|nr:4'-phosphopantetheinyl transferase superfamily protein [Bacillota bacterium]
VGAAFSAREPIGLDVEHIRPRSEALVRRICGAKRAEQDGNAVTSEVARLHDFYCVWTRKEAEFKCGPGIQLDGLGADMSANEAVREEAWLYHTWQPETDYVASVAVRVERAAAASALPSLAIEERRWSFDDLLVATPWG